MGLHDCLDHRTYHTLQGSRGATLCEQYGQHVGSSDFNWAFQIELINKPPFEDLQKFWDHSPIKYISNAKTPTMVIHNEMDMRCPVEQGEQVFVALKKLGVETEMVRFPDVFHGLSRNGRTYRRITCLNYIARWFKLYLQPEA